MDLILLSAILALLGLGGLWALYALPKGRRNNEHALLKALLRNNELLAIDRHRPDTTEELARVSRATASNYELIMANVQEIQNLRLAVDEGVRSVSRAEKRVAKTVQGARRLVRESGLEHPGLEAEAEELRDRDGEAGDEEELSTVQPDMEEANLVTGIPGYDVPPEPGRYLT